MNRQIKIGATIAYVNIVLNLLVNIFLTPFLIRSLGDGEYGVYKIVQSFSAQLSIMSFGIATLVTRNVVYYNTSGENERENKENFLFTARIISYVLVAIIVCVGVGLYFSIDGLYANTLTAKELEKAKTLFVLFLVNVGVTVLCDFNNGLIRAYEKFAIANGLNTCRVLLRVAVILVLMNIGAGSISIVLTDLILTVAIWLFMVAYCRFGLKERGKFHRFDKPLLRSCFTFSLAIFMQAIINQVNQNLDNVILGAMVSPSLVTVYSCGLTLFTSFLSLITVIGSMYGPQATKLVAEGADGKTLTEFTVRPARIQAMIAFLAIAGFALFGRNFVELWLGKGYEDVYYITLLLIVPSIFPLMESVTVNILDAMMKRMARSIILIAMCVFNVAVSICLIKWVGYFGAAIGTALSMVIGNGVVMNIYLYKKIHLNVFSMFKGIFKNTVPACLISIALGLPLVFLPNTLLWFCVKVIAFVSLYFLIMYKLGMIEEEKVAVRGIMRKIFGERKKG